MVILLHGNTPIKIDEKYVKSKKRLFVYFLIDMFFYVNGK